MVIDFLISLLEDFREANVLTKTTAVSALAFFVAAPAGVIGTWYRRGVTRLQEGNAELKRECRERRRAEEQLRREVEGLRPQTIVGLGDRVALELRDGNEERAIALIRGFVDHDAAALGPLCREIAVWHLSMVEGDPPDRHWHAAKRFATLAVHLEPEDSAAAALLAEIAARAGEAALRAGDIAATRRAWDDAWSWAPAAAEDATLIQRLLARLPEERERGNYFHYLALAQRAATAARRQFGTQDENTCSARFYLAEAMQLCGRAGEALDEVDRLLPVRTEVSGERHPHTLTSLRLRGSILRAVGDVTGALTAHRAAHAGLLERLGERHPRTLLAAAQLGESLAATSDRQAAEALLEATLALQVAALGAAHPDAVRTDAALAALLNPAVPETSPAHTPSP